MGIWMPEESTYINGDTFCLVVFTKLKKAWIRVCKKPLFGCSSGELLLSRLSGCSAHL